MKTRIYHIMYLDFPMQLYISHINIILTYIFNILPQFPMCLVFHGPFGFFSSISGEGALERQQLSTGR